jgi:hypothetical protein
MKAWLINGHWFLFNKVMEILIALAYGEKELYFLGIPGCD